MTELDFLIELLLNHKLPKVSKDAIAMRIKDVQAQIHIPTMTPTPTRLPLPANLANQAPSTLAAMAKHGDIPATAAPIPQAAPAPVEVIAQTPAAAAALASRQEAIAAALSGKVDKVHGKPRKW